MLKRLFILTMALFLACLWILLSAKEAIGLTSLITTAVLS
jgi:hypothetical protein